MGGEPCEIDNSALKRSIQTGLSSIASDYVRTQTTDMVLAKLLTANKLTSQFWFQTQLDSAKNIVTKLNELGIVPTLLKGISISTSYYPKPHYRAMRDIDILVDAGEVRQVEEVLVTLGYKQHSTYSKEFYETLHHTMPWQHCKDEVWVEVHHRLFPKTSPCYNGPIFQLDVIRKERITDDFCGLRVYRLSKEFQLVYIATHWAERFKQSGGVFALLDVALIINKHDNELDWNKVVSWSNSPYVENYVYLLLQYLRKSELLNSSVKLDQHINSLQHSLGMVSRKILNSIIDNYILAGKPFGRILTVNNTEIIWQHLLEPSPSFSKVLLLPLVVIFPKGSKNKFNLKYQLSRFRTLLNYKK
ncbi:hypothetical protein MNBD_GAMMA23-2555 [hydrothermal vent metagenome]|uniref:Nucleotidyltransferase family protein n=1 Tax=hydrothermal vent metagenome TaxID=652676 RepID=A0A3B1A1K1_9ZZZZ